MILAPEFIWIDFVAAIGSLLGLGVCFFREE